MLSLNFRDSTPDGAFKHFHGRSLIFNEAHFKIHLRYFGKVPRRGAFFCTEHFCDRKWSFQSADHYLFVELRTYSEVRNDVIKILNFKNCTATLGVSSHDCWCLKFREPLCAKASPIPFKE